MGTRNLTAVMFGGEYLVAQYGQWDGYPDGQGLTILRALRKIFAKQERAELFLSNLCGCTFGTVPELEALTAEYGDQWPTFFPELSRDTGGKIIEMIAEEPRILKDSHKFASDSLFCEWAYVVDLDKGTFEVFKGFNQQKLDDSERFANTPQEDPEESGVNKPSDYQPIKHVITFELDNLPTTSEFLKAVNALLPKEDDD